jgi:hypothetical protein
MLTAKAFAEYDFNQERIKTGETATCTALPHVDRTLLDPKIALSIRHLRSAGKHS